MIIDSAYSNETQQIDAINAYSCRRLSIDDLETVMRWRMSPHVTRFMNTDPVLTLDGQKQWYDRLLAIGILYHWIIMVGTESCGMLYLIDVDNTHKRCSWGYYIAEKRFRSFRLAVSLEMSIYDYAFLTLGLNKVVCESFCLNIVAVKLHELCGCKTEGILRQHICKNGQYFDICVQSMLVDEWKNARESIDYQRIDFNGP